VPLFLGSLYQTIVGAALLAIGHFAPFAPLKHW